MNYIFFFLILSSVILGIFNGNIDKVMSELFSACETSVKIAFSLIGIMAFWLGLMRIAEKSGLVNTISGLLHPFTKIIFKDTKEDSPALGDICMSISANALGLTNAATPIGIKVMKELQESNPKKEIATDSMCMFLAMNTAGFQIIPATVIAILVGAGAKNPTEIILPTLIVTSISFIVAILSAYILCKIWNKKEKA
ncbi:MAG: nucleoside recognition protein [bacterium]|nr:nucleoside recognition protein [bacterium]